MVRLVSLFFVFSFFPPAGPIYLFFFFLVSGHKQLTAAQILRTELLFIHRLCRMTSAKKFFVEQDLVLSRHMLLNRFSLTLSLLII